MAITTGDKLSNLKIEQEKQEKEAALQKADLLESLMISMAHPPGELPPYVPPEKPSSPWEPGKSPAPSRDKLAGLRINPNTILLPKEPAPAESDDDYGEGAPEGHPDWKLSRANNIRGFQDSGYQLNIPLHDWKQIPPGIKNDPDFIRLHLRRMQALGINPMLAGGPQLPNFKPMGPVRTGVRKGVLTPEENKIKRPLQIRGA